MAIQDVSEQTLTSLLSLKGRLAVVTGGASGIGFAISRRFAEAGANVLVGDLNEGAAQDAATRLRELGVEAAAAQLDIRDPASVTRLVETAVSDFGRLDVWVNNAGVYPNRPVLEIDNDTWDTVLDINLRGTFVGTREAAKVMREAGGGVIVNLVSTAAFNASQGANSAHYVASKHGVAGLTKSFAFELGPHNVRVVAVAPTLTETPGVARKRDEGAAEALAAYTKRVPLGRLGVPDDVARVVLFAASDLATFVSGSVLLADGGDLAG